MDIQNFEMMDGVRLSLFAMLVVFLILILLQFIIYAFKYLPKEQNDKKSVATTGISPEDSSDSNEEEMVAMLMASIMAKEEYKGDVTIKSVTRIS
jgi:Na+-transporting methylmalonyl-CoA/oxaloacetate decarboxylase gamma subunit